MTLQSSLLAFVLLVFGGGIEPSWAALPMGDATECPVAPDAPTEAESESGGEEAVFAAPSGARPGDRTNPSADEAIAMSAEESVETRPPRS